MCLVRIFCISFVFFLCFSLDSSVRMVCLLSRVCGQSRLNRSLLKLLRISICPKVAPLLALAPTNPIAISFLQLGPNSAIPIPNWDPYRNINSPIGAPTSMTGPCNRKCPFYWAFSITSTQLNVVWLNWAIASIQLLQCNWLNASIPGSGQPGQLPCDGHVVILYTGPTSSRR